MIGTRQQYPQSGRPSAQRETNLAGTIRTCLTESTNEVLGFFCFSEASINSHAVSARKIEAWMCSTVQQDTYDKK